MPLIVMILFLVMLGMGCVFLSICKLVDYCDNDRQHIPFLPWISALLIEGSLGVWCIIASQQPLAIEKETVMDIKTVTSNNLKIQVALYTDSQGQINQLNVTRLFNATLPEDYKVKMIVYKKWYCGILFHDIKDKYEIVPP